MYFSNSQIGIKLVLVSLGVLSSFSIDLVVQADSDDGRINYSDSKLEELSPLNSCNCVAFRFDDIQKDWLLDVQLEMLKTLKENNIPVTIGVIGNEFEGTVVNHVKQLISEETSNIEIANHGWEHEDFTFLDNNIQSQLLKNTNRKIFDATGQSAKIFIPPYNQANTDTLKAMKENNFTHYSSSVLYSEPPYPLITSGIYHFPETATTGAWNKKLNIFYGLPHTETLKDIKASQKIFGFSVVTLHPQEFSTIKNGTYFNQIEENQIHELNLLIDEIKKSDLKIVLLSQINENVIESFDNKEIKSSESEASINSTFSSAPSNEGGCLIATATYGSELAPQVQQLRELRDYELLKTESGSAFMSIFNEFYYSFSPMVADFERENPIFKQTVRLAITPMISSLSILNYMDMDSEAEVLGYGISVMLLNIGMYFAAPAIVIVKIKQKF